jgi:hypothetical protein
MIRELIRALFQAGLPVGITSFLLVWWALKSDYLQMPASVGEVEKGFKKLSKKKDGKKRRKKGGRAEPETPGTAADDKPRLNPVHNKWLAFGGGFYGVVALLTYAIVELAEIRDFIARYDGLAGLISKFSFGMIIELIIDALMNFVVAIAWPVYWLSDIAGEYIWVWFGVAYGGYWAGVKAALHHFGPQAGGEE